MKRSHVLGLVALLVLSVAAALLTGRPLGVEASALSRGAFGLLAARLYLEAQGTPTMLLDRSLDAPPPRGSVLVTSFPWQRFMPAERLRGLDDHLLAGGTVLVAYTGKLWSTAENRVLADMGIGWRVESGPPALHPLRWREQAGEEWSLVPDPGLRDAPPVRVSALSRVPRAPDSASVLFRRSKDLPVILSYRRGAGEVILLPAEALANGRLTAHGNADLLEALRLRLAPRPWVFDEYHHGLSAVTSPEAGRLGRVFDLYVLHLVLAYVLGVLCLARRFGPAWTEAPSTVGSVAAFLVGLGALHHRLGHHSEAAGLLVSRARDLEPRLRLPDPATTGGVTRAEDLVRLGKEVAAAQAKKGS